MGTKAQTADRDTTPVVFEARVRGSARTRPATQIAVEGSDSPPPDAGLKLKTTLRAGGLSGNHCTGLRVKTAIKAGRIAANHNPRMVGATASTKRP